MAEVDQPRPTRMGGASENQNQRQQRESDGGAALQILAQLGPFWCGVLGFYSKQSNIDRTLVLTSFQFNFIIFILKIL